MSQVTTPTPNPTPASTTDSVEAKRLSILMSNLATKKKKNLRERIEKLIATGRTTKDYAEKRLLPKLEVFAMGELDEATGEFAMSDLEERIEDLESANPLTGTSLLDDPNYTAGVPDGYAIEVPPVDAVGGPGTADIPDALLDEIYDEAGYPH